MSGMKWAVLFCVFAGCEFSLPPPNACDVQRISEAVGAPSPFDVGGVRRYETDAGVTLYFGVSRSSQLGTLQGVLHEPFVGGAVPREATTAAGCVLSDKVSWRSSTDDSVRIAAATLSVLDGGTAAGDSLHLRVTDAGFPGDDGGWRALDDFEVVLEVR